MTADKHLHIVSLEVPYPVSHGGLFDIFYKLIALHTAGVKISLHCFRKKGHEQDEPAARRELGKYCIEVFFYNRSTGFAALSSSLPYIVASRCDEGLLTRLLEDDHPILVEGIHCTYLLNDERFRERKILLRLHNVEYKYYQQLYRNAAYSFRKWYYLYESRLLRNYERKIARLPAMIFAVARTDVATYTSEFRAVNIIHLPVFTGHRKVSIREGLGNYCLYHGNLSVPENEKAAGWLLKNVFSRSGIPFVIAGKDPSTRLKQKVRKHGGVRLIGNPGDEEMQELIANAQCHVLPSFNSTGIKLKLINALFNGRHCIVNPAAVQGSALEPCCHVASGPTVFRSVAGILFGMPLSPEEASLRKDILENMFDDGKNALSFVQYI